MATAGDDMANAGARTSALAGVRVVIVEDEAMLALALEDTLGEMGCHVVGAANRLVSALPLVADAAFDLAILDVNLNGSRIDDVADAVIARGIPLIFATGYRESGVPARQRGWPIVNKPYTTEDLERAMTAALSKKRRETGAAEGELG